MARGAGVYGILKGCGEKADLFHRTRSSPDGGPAIATIRAALADAGISEERIGYINAHGTSTPENDKMEYRRCRPSSARPCRPFRCRRTSR